MRYSLWQGGALVHEAETLEAAVSHAGLHAHFELLERVPIHVVDEEAGEGDLVAEVSASGVEIFNSWSR